MKKNYTLKIVLFLLCLFFIMNFSKAGFAQIVYPYTVDFESSSEGSLPPNKTYGATSIIHLHGIDWIMPGVYLGNMIENDKYIDSRAARIRLTENTTGLPGYLEMQDNLPEGIGTVSYLAAMYGTETGGILVLQTSIDDGLTWVTQAEDTLSDILTPYYYNLNIAEPIRLKFLKGNPGNQRINLDNIEITASYDTLFITETYPRGIHIDFGIDSLILHFNQPVQPHTGSIQVVDNDGIIQTFNVMEGIVESNTIKFTGLTLENNKSYHILSDDSTFKLIDKPIFLNSVTEDSLWTFKTINSQIIEEFDHISLILGCNGASDDTLSDFIIYNETGPLKTWYCTNDSLFAMHGAIDADNSEISKDWLITKHKYATEPWTMGEINYEVNYEGTSNYTILFSDDYVLHQNPELYTWEIYYHEINDETNYRYFEFHNPPKHIAILYESTDLPSREFTLMQMTLFKGSSIEKINQEKETIKIIGRSNRSLIDLQYISNDNNNISIHIIDLLGRKIYENSYQVQKGLNNIQIQNINAGYGMHIIHTKKGAELNSVKVLIE